MLLRPQNLDLLYIVVNLKRSKYGGIPLLVFWLILVYLFALVMELWVFYDVRDHWDLLGWHLVFGPETDVFRFILRKVFHVDVLFITICTVVLAPSWYGRKWRIGDELRLKPNRCQFKLNIRVKLSLQICALFKQLLFLLIWLRLRNLFFESQEFSLNWHPTCKLRM